MTEQSIYSRIKSRRLQQPQPTEAAEESSVDYAKSSAKGRRLAHRTLWFAALAMAIGVATFTYYWFSPFGGALFAGDATAPKPHPEIDESSPFAQHTRNAGVQTCRPLFVALGGALTAGSKYSVQTQWDKTQPNAHALQALVGLTYQGQNQQYAGSAAGVVFAGPHGNACEGDMVRVTPLQQTCASVAAALPKGSTAGADLSGVNLYTLPNGQGQVLLVPSANACVVVSVGLMVG
jgi:hypothetical protein